MPFLARFSGRSSHKFEPAVCIKRPMYTTQTGRIQIFDQLSAHFIKTTSSSMATSFVSIAWFTVHEDITSDGC